MTECVGSFSGDIRLQSHFGHVIITSLERTPSVVVVVVQHDEEEKQKMVLLKNYFFRRSCTVLAYTFNLFANNKVTGILLKLVN